MARCSEPTIGRHGRWTEPMERRGIDRDGHLALPLGGHGADGRRQRAGGGIDAGQAGHRVDVLVLDAGGGVDVGPVRDREHVTALVVDGRQRTTGLAAMDEVPDGARDRRPRHRHLAATPLGTDVGRGRQDDVRRRPVPLGRGADALEPCDPGGTGCRRRGGPPPGLGRHGRRYLSAALRGPALNRSMPMTGRSIFRNSLVANASRSTSLARALPIDAMTMPWSSDR